jgi:hypothetical protein
MMPLALICLLLGAALTRQLRASRHLRANERLARECMRDAMKNRDEVVEELHEERRRAYEMQLELDAYRAEETVRREAIRVIRQLRSN